MLHTNTLEGDSEINDFSIEEELKYSRRLEEGYNLPDERYECWLRINHPDALSESSSNSMPVASTSARSSPSFTAVCSPPGSVSPSLPLPLTSGSCPVSPLTPASNASLPLSPLNTPQSHSHSGFTKGSGKRSPFSELLNIPRAVQKEKTLRTGKARVLTSSECLSILKEKENKKRREAEEKEKRMQERLLKKKQRDEEQQRKQEDKAHRAAERAKKGEEKAKRKIATRAPPPASIEAGPSQKKIPLPSAEVGPSRKRARLDVDDIDHSIYSDLCCVCFGDYADDEGTGREWLQCLCSRWIHEDCMDITDNTGKICPLC